MVSELPYSYQLYSERFLLLVIVSSSFCPARIPQSLGTKKTQRSILIINWMAYLLRLLFNQFLHFKLVHYSCLC